jgi:dynactin-5
MPNSTLRGDLGLI